MRIFSTFLISPILLILICSSCLTKTVWDNINPNENVWIPADSITEVSLIKNGIRYEKFDQKEPKGYLVKKSAIRKLGDYTLLTLATPITVTVDGVIIAVFLWAPLGGPIWVNP